jgi:hypothetical protein
VTSSSNREGRTTRLAQTGLHPPATCACQWWQCVEKPALRPLNPARPLKLVKVTVTRYTVARPEGFAGSASDGAISLPLHHSSSSRSLSDPVSSSGPFLGPERRRASWENHELRVISKIQSSAVYVQFFLPRLLHNINSQYDRLVLTLSHYRSSHMPRTGESWGTNYMTMKIAWYIDQNCARVL